MDENDRLHLLLRRGEEEHIKNLYEKGILRINTISCVRNCGKNFERSDSDDCLMYRLGDSYLSGNILCFYGVYNRHLNLAKDCFEVEIESFGEWLIFIHSPSTFIQRVDSALKRSGYRNFIHNKVNYYKNDYLGEVGAFRKRDRFEHQSEFRFYIDNKSNQMIEINVGSLKDIAEIKQDIMIKISLTDGSNKILTVKQKKDESTNR